MSLEFQRKSWKKMGQKMCSNRQWDRIPRLVKDMTVHIQEVHSQIDENQNSKKMNNNKNYIWFIRYNGGQIQWDISKLFGERGDVGGDLKENFQPKILHSAEICIKNQCQIKAISDLKGEDILQFPKQMLKFKNCREISVEFSMFKFCFIATWLTDCCSCVFVFHRL